LGGLARRGGGGRCGLGGQDDGAAGGLDLLDGAGGGGLDLDGELARNGAGAEELAVAGGGEVNVHLAGEPDGQVADVEGRRLGVAVAAAVLEADAAPRDGAGVLVLAAEQLEHEVAVLVGAGAAAAATQSCATAGLLAAAVRVVAAEALGASTRCHLRH